MKNQKNNIFHSIDKFVVVAHGTRGAYKQSDNGSKRFTTTVICFVSKHLIILFLYVQKKEFQMTFFSVYRERLLTEFFKVYIENDL